MKIYEVGGCVRDRLLGIPYQDIDYVVIGATPEDLLARGYEPVGKDFPVFIDKTTGCEYALARTERKIGAGYHGFECHTAPTVTLVEDLKRRDLTINAMAYSKAEGVIDPYGGQQDIANRILREVSPAFREDPLRVLRAAKFYARLHCHGFQIAPSLTKLATSLSQSGELAALPKERVAQELLAVFNAPGAAHAIDWLLSIGALHSLCEPLAEALCSQLATSPWHDALKHIDSIIKAADKDSKSLELVIEWPVLRLLSILQWGFAKEWDVFDSFGMPKSVQAHLKTYRQWVAFSEAGPLNNVEACFDVMKQLGLLRENPKAIIYETLLAQRIASTDNAAAAQWLEQVKTLQPIVCCVSPKQVLNNCIRGQEQAVLKAAYLNALSQLFD